MITLRQIEERVRDARSLREDSPVRHRAIVSAYIALRVRGTRRSLELAESIRDEYRKIEGIK